MLVSSKTIQIFSVKSTGGGTDSECRSLNVHRQAQHRLAVSSDAALPALWGGQAADSGKVHPTPPAHKR